MSKFYGGQFSTSGGRRSTGLFVVTPDVQELSDKFSKIGVCFLNTVQIN